MKKKKVTTEKKKALGQPEAITPDERRVFMRQLDGMPPVKKGAFALYHLAEDLMDKIGILSTIVHLLNDQWWRNPKTGKRIQRNKGEMIALMHSELSEALEALRKDAKDDKLPNRPGVEVELADCVIRILDYCAGFKLDLAGAIIEKLAFNVNRADHKPENRIKAGGKRF